MAVTTTPRFALPQWSAGADTPSRVAFNQAFANLDAQAAKDLGAAGGTALPTTGLSDGMYHQTVDGNYRRFYRRAGGAWAQIGGNTWSEPTYARADAALGAATPARVVSHPSLAAAGLTENWDGSSVRGGRQAIGDFNSLPGALHVGDTDSAVDLAARGRIYARTRANNERGFVASAHGAGAGPLFTARDAGGSDAWTVDSAGRMRAQVPTAFGGGALAAGVPLSVAPSSGDATGLDAYASGSVPGQRWWRAAGDTTPIGSVTATAWVLGRSTWAGGSISLLAPSLIFGGPITAQSTLDVAGAATLRSGLSVAGTTSLAGLSTSGDISVGGRLAIPTTQPGGVVAGQVRIGSDWALEVFDGSRWRGRFGGVANGKGLWTQSSANLSNITNTVITGLAASSTQTPLATLSNGRVTLKRAGLWRLMLRSYCDPQIYASMRVWMNWSGGAFLEGPDVIGQGTNLEGWGGAGRNWAVAQWVGYVDEDAMANIITLYAHQSNRTSSVLTGITYWFTAEYLSP